MQWILPLQLPLCNNVIIPHNDSKKVKAIVRHQWSPSTSWEWVWRRPHRRRRAHPYDSRCINVYAHLSSPHATVYNHTITNRIFYRLILFSCSLFSCVAHLLFWCPHNIIGTPSIFPKRRALHAKTSSLYAHLSYRPALSIQRTSPGTKNMLKKKLKFWLSL